MFYLQVEITNYKQLKIIIPHILDPLEKKISQSVLSSGGEKHATYSGLYCFHSTFRETSMTVVSTAFQIFQYLSGVADKLYGFSIILSDSIWDEDELDFNLRNYIYRIPQENNIWLYEDPKKMLEQHVTLVRKEGLDKISDQKEELPGTAERMKRFCRRDAQIESINDSINSLTGLLADKGVIHVSGELFSGREYNLNEVLDKRCGDDTEPMLFLRNCISQNPLDPFIWSLNPDIEENVTRYLDNGDLDLWKAMNPQLELFKNSWDAEQCSDFSEKDFITLYSLYLKAYVKIRKEKRLLPVIICKAVDEWNDRSIALLGELLSTFVTKEGLIPICTSSDSHWLDNLNGIRVRTIDFKALSVEEVRKKVESSFPELKLVDKEIYSFFKANKGLPIPMFLALLSSLERGYLREKEHPVLGTMEGFDQLTLTILYLINLAKGLINVEEYIEFFDNKGIGASRVRERIEYLILLSIIDGSQYPRPLFPELEDVLEKKVLPKEKDLLNSFTNYLFSLWEKGTHLNIENLFQIILKYGQTGKSLQIFQTLVDRFLNNKQFQLAEHYLTGSYFAEQNLSIGEKDALMNIIFAGKMRSALLRENYRDVQSIISESEILKVHKKSAFTSQSSLQQSIYMNCIGDYSRGLNLAKEALFEFQQSGNSAGEAKANIELASALLGQGKIRTSQDYFEISRRASFQSGDLLCQIRSSFFKALSDFIFGNIPMALRGVNDILPVTDKSGRREWQLMLIHLKGRILFDLGRYRDCEDLYKEGYQIARNYGMEQAASLLRRWTARSLVYNERFRDGLEILRDMEQNDESLFFLAEAAFFGRREEKALEYINSAGTQFRRIDYIPGETPLWKDGFASIEGYSLSRDGESDVLMAQIQALRYYLEGLNGELEKSVIGFSELTGRYNSQAANHYFHKYFYLYSAVLPESFNDEEKRLKILSNSVKLLQSRAGRFDDQKMKHSFLNYNIWNKKITEESVRRNFI